MTSASSIPLSSTLRVLSQNVKGFQTKITMRKRKQTRIVALGSVLRSLEVHFFAIQEPHFVTTEDRQAGMRCLSKYGYGLDGPLHEEGRGGVALAWKTSKWTLQSMKFLSPRALKASLSSGPLEITLVVVHFHQKQTRRQSQWKDIAKELHGPNLILCADHNSLSVKPRDAFAPPEFEHDTSLRAREQEVATLAKAGLQDVWVDIHCPTLTDIKDKDSSCPTGFTYGYPREGERLDPQRLRRIDRIHTTSELLSLRLACTPCLLPTQTTRRSWLNSHPHPSKRKARFPDSTVQRQSSKTPGQWKTRRPLSSLSPRRETNGGKMHWAASKRRPSITKGNTKTKSSQLNFKLYGSYVSPQGTPSHRRSIRFFHHWELQQQKRQRLHPPSWGI